MISNTDISKKYDLLIDTLIMSCSDLGVTTTDEIEDYLEELEGDYYTFFDRANLIELYNAGLLNDWQLEKIGLLKNKIGDIPVSFWNEKSFKIEPQWSEVRILSNHILNSIGITKRKID